MNIRNFCIIAHIDHGKSTLADRFLELTNTVSKREMKEQILDSMDLERERGITIKLTPVRMNYKPVTCNLKPETCTAQKGLQVIGYRLQEYILNLIDTPGHVDFNYEVSRSLAAVEGAILLVDATQGVQAQTIGNLYLALEQNLKIIPVINKIDLPNAQIEKTKTELANLLGGSTVGANNYSPLLCSAKTGEGVAEILKAVVERIPPPTGESATPLRALIFDSVYDDYRGVVAFVRVVDGEVKRGDKILMLMTGAESEVLEVGYFKPKYQPAEKLSAGEIGYIVTGLKTIEKCRVGDTITNDIARPKAEAISLSSGSLRFARDIVPLPGYREVKPMVFAGIFCQEGADYIRLREAIAKLKLNDAALVFEPEHSAVLGFGFRCGFLGLLHLDIFQERLKREHKMSIVVTVPSVAYRLTATNDEIKIIKSPTDLPDPSKIKKIEEPWVAADIVSPKDYLGQIMALVEEKHGLYKNTEYLESDRVILHYEIPLAAILVDFYDRLKGVSAGYGSLNYELTDYKEADIVKLTILVAEEEVEALTSLVYRDEAYRVARKIVEKLKETLPRQMFEVKIQAALGGSPRGEAGKIIAAERLPAMRKDVLAKMSGGDWTRKMKLLQKQKKGKSRLKAGGHVKIPPETYLAILKK